MARRNGYGQERNPLKMVLYIIAVLAMLGCIGYLVYSSRVSSQEYQENVRRAAAEETELETEERKTERETEKTTEQDTTANKKDTESPETESETDTEAALVMTDLSILVLNGTGKPGVAGYWKTQLEKRGYTNVTPASYTETVGDETVIYAANNAQTGIFKELFPNAETKIGTVDTGLEAATGIPLPEKCDVYIIIGNKDARSE